MRMKLQPGNRKTVAFTLIEVLLAIGIFSMVMVAIYSSWSAVLRGSRIGLKAAAEVQRTRITIGALEDAVSGAVMYADNAQYYAFFADTSGDYAYVSFVSRLPHSFPGSGLFPGQPVRRVTFMVDQDKSLKLMQTPILEAADMVPQPYIINLAPKVGLFAMEFFDPRQREWVPEWIYTNQLPQMVRVGIGFSDKQEYSGPTTEMTVRTIPLAAMSISRIGGGRGQANISATGMEEEGWNPRLPDNFQNSGGGTRNPVFQR